MNKIRDFLLPFDDKRDVLLDVCKGIAILLVVLGHYFQMTHTNFDDFFGFAFIYSFHMPLFTLLAGASAAFWIKKINFHDDYKSFAKALLKRVTKAFQHLIIPFFFWILFQYFYINSDKELISYIWMVVKQADWGLWFLPLIFWCTAFICVFLLVIFFAYKVLKSSSNFERISKLLLSINVQVLLMYIFWKVAKYLHLMPSIAGLQFVNYFHGGLFFYFLLGIVFYQAFVGTKFYLLRVVPYVLFFALVPYWDRLGTYNISSDAKLLLSQGWFVRHYAFVVALSGTLVFIDLSRLIVSLNLRFLTRVITTLGVASLAIYAIHQYVLGFNPVWLAPLIIPVVIFRITGLYPPIKRVMFG
ncbi:acyltransferase family protein [Vibrio cionasavignyae]|uniref:acyltransferase family protein n=1 Tax=Vibrio cionasavignyae TaxID=2910252 RepID=UPI003D0A5367